MQKQVTIRFAAGREIVIGLHAGTELPTAEEANRWLDEQFVAHECVPLRATGKLLTSEKPLAIAAALGPSGFESADYSETFARMTLAALGNASAHLDLTASHLRG